MRTLVSSELDYVAGGDYVKDLFDFTGWANGAMASAAVGGEVTDALEGAAILSEFGPAGALVGLAAGAATGYFVSQIYTRMP